METAYRFPILAPKESESLKDFLERAARTHHWPAVTLEDDLKILGEMLTTLSDEKVAAHFGAYILRALSFVANSSMGLRHLDRYLRTSAQNGDTQLEKLRDNPEHLHFLVSFFSFSTYLSEIVIAHPEFLDWIFKRSNMNREKSLERYREQVCEWVEGVEGIVARREALTLYKKRELLRIGVKEILELGGTRELCHELSNLAQAIIEVCYQDCFQDLLARHGKPIIVDTGKVCPYAIYAMGKFGAGELNFSSDVDLIFVYGEEGNTQGRQETSSMRTGVISNHEFFNKLSAKICSYQSDHNKEGFLFRTDARLRPEGSEGPLARSMAAYVIYLNNNAALWEKIAYLKARCIAGQESWAVNFDKIIEQFVYGHNVPEELFPEVSRLKRRIDFERLDEHGREHDIKRGRGGIREIEFIVSALQLVHGQNELSLRVRPTLEALELLSKHDLLNEDTIKKLTEAYHLFRRIEHTLQMMHESQTHLMPSDPLDRDRLGIRCGFLKVVEFERHLEELRSYVRHVFDSVFRNNESTDQLTLLDMVFGSDTPPKEILDELKPCGLNTIEGFGALRRLALGTTEHAPSRQGREEFRKLLPIILKELPYVAQPLQAVHHFDLLLRAAKGFSWIYDLCLSHPPVVKLLLTMLGFGSYLARQLIAHPEWLDELFHGDGLYEGRTKKAIHRQEKIMKGLSPEEALGSIRIFKSLETFMISTQEVLGMASSHEAAKRTTKVAQYVLDQVREISTRQILAETGESKLPVKWCVLGLGGIGDGQVHANGDLDIAVVVDYDEVWNGVRLIEWVDRIGKQMINHLSAISVEGQLWKVDARLRPDGQHAPLAATKERFFQYYEKEAGLWEWQALTKARAVSGDIDFGTSVLNELYVVFGKIGPLENLKSEIHAMKRRIDGNIRLPRTALFDMKTGRGGVTEIEFLVQSLQLKNFKEAALLFPLTTEQALELFIDRGEIDKVVADGLLLHLRLLRMLQRHHRLLWETVKDYYPQDQEKEDALWRGVAEQMVLQGLKKPISLAKEMSRVGGLFEDFFGKEEG
jgi:[glutamine synthetase] adenylyltransferase / [glutamine synthetase]-adenylyl-L-tyrosine phosphorylase